MIRERDLGVIFNNTYSESKERNIKILTGQSGMELFHLALEKQNDIDYTNWLIENKHISKEQGERIKSMINSPDKENYELAKTVLMEWREGMDYLNK